MGLDMYFYKRNYVKNFSHLRTEEQNQITVTKGGKNHPTIKSERIVYVIEEVGYWRKFNALHNWFVENVQNGVDECQETYVPYEKLEELHDILQQVKANKGNMEVVSGFLPTANGFFFGSTDYDDYYYEDVNRTIKIIEECLKDESGSYYYKSSW